MRRNFKGRSSTSVSLTKIQSFTFKVLDDFLIPGINKLIQENIEIRRQQITQEKAADDNV